MTAGDRGLDRPASLRNIPSRHNDPVLLPASPRLPPPRRSGRELETADARLRLDGVLIDHSLRERGNGRRLDREEEEGRVNGGGGQVGVGGNSWDL